MLGNDGLDYRICKVDSERTPVEVVARAAHFSTAIAAYTAALDVYPRDDMALLMRARIIRHRAFRERPV